MNSFGAELGARLYQFQVHLCFGRFPLLLEIVFFSRLACRTHQGLE